MDLLRGAALSRRELETYDDDRHTEFFLRGARKKTRKGPGSKIGERSRPAREGARRVEKKGDVRDGREAPDCREHLMAPQPERGEMHACLAFFSCPLSAGEQLKKGQSRGRRGI